MQVDIELSLQILYSVFEVDQDTGVGHDVRAFQDRRQFLDFLADLADLLVHPIIAAAFVIEHAAVEFLGAYERLAPVEEANAVGAPGNQLVGELANQHKQ